MADWAGHNILIKIDTNDVGGAGASWATIGLQRAGSIALSRDLLDASNKDTPGWKKVIGGNASFSVPVEGILDAADVQLAKLRTAVTTRVKVWIQIDADAMTSGLEEEFEAIVMNFVDRFVTGELVQYTAELVGDSAITTSP